MKDSWEVEVWGGSRVVITPPYIIDRAFGDVILRVEGNMLEAEKITIASKIVSVLNTDLCNESKLGNKVYAGFVEEVESGKINQPHYIGGGSSN